MIWEQPVSSVTQLVSCGVLQSEGPWFKPHLHVFFIYITWKMAVYNVTTFRIAMRCECNPGLIQASIVMYFYFQMECIFTCNVLVTVPKSKQSPAQQLAITHSQPHPSTKSVSQSVLLQFSLEFLLVSSIHFFLHPTYFCITGPITLYVCHLQMLCIGKHTHQKRESTQATTVQISIYYNILSK